MTLIYIQFALIMHPTEFAISLLQRIRNRICESDLDSTFTIRILDSDILENSNLRITRIFEASHSFVIWINRYPNSFKSESVLKLYCLRLAALSFLCAMALS